MTHRELIKQSRLGGQARAKALTPARRSAIARLAARARWSRTNHAVHVRSGG